MTTLELLLLGVYFLLAHFLKLPITPLTLGILALLFCAIRLAMGSTLFARATAPAQPQK